MHTHILSTVKRCGIISLLLVLLSCSSDSVKPSNKHTFSFDAQTESPDAIVLDYHYGNSTTHGAAKYASLPSNVGKIKGTKLEGDMLYIKWRLKSTNATYEDLVDLHKRLPTDITGYKVHAVIKGAQLYVYLISPNIGENRCAAYKNKAIIPPAEATLAKNCDKIIYTVYPDPDIPNRFK